MSHELTAVQPRGTTPVDLPQIEQKETHHLHRIEGVVAPIAQVRTFTLYNSTTVVEMYRVNDSLTRGMTVHTA
jgi:hypothetical protein